MKRDSARTTDWISKWALAHIQTQSSSMYGCCVCSGQNVLEQKPTIISTTVSKGILETAFVNISTAIHNWRSHAFLAHTLILTPRTTFSCCTNGMNPRKCRIFESNNMHISAWICLKYCCDGDDETTNYTCLRAYIWWFS